MPSQQTHSPEHGALTTVAAELDRELAAGEVGIYLSTRGLEERALTLQSRAQEAGLAARARRAALLRSDVLSRRGELEGALRLQLMVLGTAEADADRLTCARAHSLLASTHDRLADVAKSQAAAQAGVQLLEQGDPPAWHAEHTMILGLFTSYRRRAAIDFTTFDEAASQARQHGDPVLLLAILNNYAVVALEASDPRGIALADEMRELVERELPGGAPSPWLDTIALGLLAAGKLDDAAAAIEAAIVAAPADMVEPGCVAYCLLTAASVERARGNLPRAEELVHEAQRRAEQEACPEPAALALKELAALAAGQARYRDAYELLDRYLHEWSRFQSERSELHAATVQAIYGAETERRRRLAVERLADTDPLTGLWNRRYLNRRLDELSGRPLAIALLDIDHFKQVNDRFSHDAGDAVLRHLANLLLLHARPDDGTDAFACRIGGEEFVLVMPGPDRDEGFRCCERIRAHLQASDWDGVVSDLTVTASIGLAFDPDGMVPPSQLLSRADVRLYEAKRRGRNRVVADL